MESDYFSMESDYFSTFVIPSAVMHAFSKALLSLFTCCLVGFHYFLFVCFSLKNKFI